MSWQATDRQCFAHQSANNTHRQISLHERRLEGPNANYIHRQAALHENRPCPPLGHRLLNSLPLPAPDSGSEGGKRWSTNTERGNVEGASWVWSKCKQIASRYNQQNSGAPPVPAVPIQEVPNTSIQHQRQPSSPPHWATSSWLARQRSLLNPPQTNISSQRSLLNPPQTNISSQSTNPIPDPQGLPGQYPRFTLHPSVPQELHHLQSDSVPGRQRPARLPRNWTLGNPLPHGLNMTWLWDNQAGSYIPHIYPDPGQWKNYVGIQVDTELWGAPLDMSADPPWWFAKDIDLGPALLGYPPEIQAAQANITRRRQNIRTTLFYRFDPWADVRLYERNQYGELERLNMYEEWLMDSTGTYSDIPAVSLLNAERDYHQPPCTGRIFDAESEETDQSMLEDMFTGEPALEGYVQELCDSLEPSAATPESLLGVNPWMGQLEYPDQDGYTGVLRPIRRPNSPESPRVLKSVTPYDEKQLTLYGMPQSSTAKLTPLAWYQLPPPESQTLQSSFTYPTPQPGFNYPMPQSGYGYPMPQPGYRHPTVQNPYPTPPPVSADFLLSYQAQACAYGEAAIIENPPPGMRYYIPLATQYENSATPHLVRMRCFGEIYGNGW